MNKYSTCTIGRFANERSIAITTECLNKEYPNVTFEARETGDGHYELSVYSVYGNVPSRTLLVFKNVAYVLYSQIPNIEKILSR